MRKIENNNNIFLISALIVFGIWISYVHQMSPSPLLIFIREDYGIYNNDALLNISVSIIFPMIIIASLLGGFIEQKIGTKNLFVWTMLFVAIGVALSFVSVNYYIFLLGRALYGIGFGLGIPFIGSAIMKWYTPKQQAIMNTINGLFPFLGNVAGFGFLVPLYTILNNSWKGAIGIWGIFAAVIIILWVIFSKREDYTKCDNDTVFRQAASEKNLYLNLWRRKEIKLLFITFGCDFFCYSFISVILPTYFMELGNMTEAAAGLLAAIAFPAIGIFGGITGGLVMTKSGRRKPIMAIGQILKTLGITISALGANISFWVVIVGICFYGFGNSQWIPGMYTVAMELDDMNPTRVGGAFALIMAGGFIFGFISPIIGGWLTNQFMAVSGIADPLANHVYGLQWSLFIFGFLNLIGFVCILLLEETGPAARRIKEINLS